MSSKKESVRHSELKFSVVMGFGLMLVFTLLGCENGIVGTGLNETNLGVAQKGPFEIGSNVVITTRTGSDYAATRVDQMQTLDHIGSFEFSFEPNTLYEIAVTGKHYNEITGVLSQEPMTLQSTYFHDENSKSFVSINILTHLIHLRINHLISVGQLHPRDAIAQASRELIDQVRTFIFADHLNNFSFSNMTIYNSYTDSDTNANAVLLFISSAFYQQSELYDNSRPMVEMLTTIVDDLELDGEIDGDENPDPVQPPDDSNNGPAIISSLDFAARVLNPEVITQNLTQYSIDKTGVAIPVPSIDFLLDHDADGITNNVDVDDDGDGLPDAIDMKPYQFQITPAVQTFNTSSGATMDLGLEFNKPEDSAANPIYLGLVGQPQNGTLSGVYPNLHYTSDPGFIGTDTFTYEVTCVPCKAVVTGVYTSPEITVTINVIAP